MNKPCLRNNFLIIAVLVLSLQACTISHYRLRNNNNSTKPSVVDPAAPCSFKYSLDVQYEPRFTHIEPAFGSEAPQKMVERYNDATKEALKEKACDSEQVPSAQANLDIQILVSPLVSALPQEWLTGLSLGLIPSWGTRHGEFVYKFENRVSERGTTRFVDRPAFNHLIVFPVFWISFIGTDEVDLYKKALINFVEESSK